MASPQRIEFPPPPESLRSRYELASTEINLAGNAYHLLRPKSVDDLISEEDFAIDERIPYWADCWPSAKVLAAHMATLAGDGRNLLELGCGVGLVSLVSARAGFEVLATDYYREALEFTAANAERHGIDNVDTRLVDWRALPDDLEMFDVVAASDVLYERPMAALVAGIMARVLKSDGVGILTDPGRRPAEGFIGQCDEQGLKAECVERVPYQDASASLTVYRYEVRRK